MKASEQASCACDTPRAEQIAQLNDTLRETGRGGEVFFTRSIVQNTALSPVSIMQALASYDAFDADNDPHGERDFGDIEVNGTSLLWKIDYYNREKTFGSDDPADPDVTSRVLTVMLPDDW
ncbi:DUF3768 domain-containing protein [Erythrobacter sp.]|uniref:DUF3768 domain-containing protein n=1 Tax=Erythrobacter sp. TaxID=1042 RepID=UPI003C7914BA